MLGRLKRLKIRFADWLNQLDGWRLFRSAMAIMAVLILLLLVVGMVVAVFSPSTIPKGWLAEILQESANPPVSEPTTGLELNKVTATPTPSATPSNTPEATLPPPLITIVVTVKASEVPTQERLPEPIQTSAPPVVTVVVPTPVMTNPSPTYTITPTMIPPTALPTATYTPLPPILVSVTPTTVTPTTTATQELPTPTVFVTNTPTAVPSPSVTSSSTPTPTTSATPMPSPSPSATATTVPDTPTPTDVPPTLTPTATAEPLNGCELVAADNDFIVPLDLNRKIRSSEDLTKTQIGPLPVELPKGTYWVTLVSYDDHQAQEEDAEQPNEQYYILLLKNGNPITQSGSISDLPTDRNWLVEQLPEPVTLPQAATELIAAHSAPDDVENRNSVYAACAAFKIVDEN